LHPDAYEILAAPSEAELRVKDSRFLALALPLRSEAAAAERREELTRRHPDARHLCWALRLGPPAGGLLRSSDAGEPAGSAGAPIARALESAGLSDLLLAVLRWFGGTKLGVGGLVRAYGEAARQALAAAPRSLRMARVPLAGEIPYDLEAPLRALLQRLEGRLAACEYGERICCRVELPPSALAQFETALRDLQRGEFGFRATATDDEGAS